MIAISQQQARARFKILPEPLQDIIFAFQTSEIIRRIAEQNHIPEEKIPGIAETAGFVLLGFLHPEEAAKEIAERSGIDLQVAKTIADALDSRLFKSIRLELDRIYAPTPHEEEAAPVIHEVRKPEAGERVVRLDSLRVEGGAPFAKTPPPAPAPISGIAPPPAGKPLSPPAPAPIASVPISRTMPMPSAPPAVPPQAGVPPKPPMAPPVGGFPHAPSPAGGAPKPAPPPFILHQESVAEPMKKAPPIGLSLPNQLDTIRREIKVPPRPAQVEVGGAWPPAPQAGMPPKPAAAPPKPPMPAQQSKEEPRVIHYGPFKTPLSEEKPKTPPPAPPAGGAPPNLPAAPGVIAKTFPPGEPPKQAPLPPQNVMPQAKSQPPAFLPKTTPEPPRAIPSSAQPAQKATPLRTLPKPPSPPPAPPVRGLSPTAPPPAHGPISGTAPTPPAVPPTAPPQTGGLQKPVAAPPAPPPTGGAPKPVPPQPPPTPPSAQMPQQPVPQTPPRNPAGNPPRKELVIDLDTLQKKPGP